MINKSFTKLKEKLVGPIQTIFVPFNKNDSIDYKSLKKHIIQLCNLHFVNVLYLMPYNGRYSQLDEKEIFKLNAFCIKEVKKHKKIIIVSDPIHASTNRKLKFCLHAKKNGADIFSSIFREKYFSDNQVFKHFEALNSANFQILIHLMPFLSGYDGRNIDWDLSILKKISSLKNVIAIKEDTKNYEYGKKILKKFGNRFSIIFAGRKKLIIDLKKYGLKSYLNGTSIIDPQIDDIFWSLLELNLIEAKKFVKDIDDPFWNIVIKKFGWHRVNKACLEINGVMKRYERLPMIPLSNYEFEILRLNVNKIKNKLFKWKI